MLENGYFLTILREFALAEYLILPPRTVFDLCVTGKQVKGVKVSLGPGLKLGYECRSTKINKTAQYV
jgi:hypothetical protein